MEHVGSFVRPDHLVQAAHDHRAGKIDTEAFRQATDAAITDIIRFQEEIGLPSVTDGEFRRRSWSAGFIDAVDGFGLRAGNIGFRTETGEIGAASSPYAKSPLRRSARNCHRGILVPQIHRAAGNAEDHASPRPM